MNLENIIAAVKPYYESKDIMHDLSHLERVMVSVRKLLKLGNYQVDLDVIQCALYFHGVIYQNEKELIELLKNQGVSKEQREKIITVAWESQKDEAATTSEGKLLHDAHMIEGGKTYLIVKALITGSVRGQSLNQTLDYIDHHKGKGICYLPEAQQIYKAQLEFAEDFMSDLRDGLME